MKTNFRLKTDNRDRDSEITYVQLRSKRLTASEKTESGAQISVDGRVHVVVGLRNLCCAGWGAVARKKQILRLLVVRMCAGLAGEAIMLCMKPLRVRMIAVSIFYLSFTSSYVYLYLFHACQPCSSCRKEKKNLRLKNEQKVTAEAQSAN